MPRKKSAHRLQDGVKHPIGNTFTLRNELLAASYELILDPPRPTRASSRCALRRPARTSCQPVQPKRWHRFADGPETGRRTGAGEAGAAAAATGAAPACGEIVEHARLIRRRRSTSRFMASPASA